jgi:CRISPR/Cas system-associated exonuclease Cas4 (RecB family)
VRLSLDDIYTFSLCPRFYRYVQTYVQPKSKKVSIIEKIMRRAYTRRTEYEKKSEWKSVLGWIDKEVFKNVDIDNTESFLAARKMSENILIFIQKWYEQDYIRSSGASYIDVRVAYDFGTNVVVGYIPIVEAKQIPLITYVDDIEYDPLKIYNNIKVMAWASMLLEELDIEEVKIRHLIVGEKSGFSFEPATIKNNKASTIKQTVREIAASIAAGVSYPSYTEMCRSCQFRKSCRL